MKLLQMMGLYPIKLMLSGSLFVINLSPWQSWVQTKPHPMAIMWFESTERATEKPVSLVN